MKDIKPVVGHLVRFRKLDDLTSYELESYNKRKGLVGVITDCRGTRCDVLWTDGFVSCPERTILEVIN